MEEEPGRSAHRDLRSKWWRASMLVPLVLVGAAGCESDRGEVGTTLLASNLGLKPVARDNQAAGHVGPDNLQPVADPVTSVPTPSPASLVLEGSGEPAPLAPPPGAVSALPEPNNGSAEPIEKRVPVQVRLDEPAPKQPPTLLPGTGPSKTMVEASVAERPASEQSRSLGRPTTSAETTAAEATPVQATEWVVSRGSTLRSTLEGWARTASREIVYQLPEDMAVDVDGRFMGTFDEALAWLLRGFDSARPRPIARVRSNAVLIQGSKDDLGGGARS